MAHHIEHHGFSVLCIALVRSIERLENLRIKPFRCTRLPHGQHHVTCRWYVYLHLCRLETRPTGIESPDHQRRNRKIPRLQIVQSVATLLLSSSVAVSFPRQFGAVLISRNNSVSTYKSPLNRLGRLFVVSLKESNTL